MNNRILNDAKFNVDTHLPSNLKMANAIEYFS